MFRRYEVLLTRIAVVLEAMYAAFFGELSDGPPIIVVPGEPPSGNGTEPPAGDPNADYPPMALVRVQAVDDNVISYYREESYNASTNRYKWSKDTGFKPNVGDELAVVANHNAKGSPVKSSGTEGGADRTARRVVANVTQNTVLYWEEPAIWYRSPKYSKMVKDNFKFS